MQIIHTLLRDFLTCDYRRKCICQVFTAPSFHAKARLIITFTLYMKSKISAFEQLLKVVSILHLNCPDWIKVMGFKDLWFSPQDIRPSSKGCMKNIWFHIFDSMLYLLAFLKTHEILALKTVSDSWKHKCFFWLRFNCFNRVHLSIIFHSLGFLTPQNSVEVCIILLINSIDAKPRSGSV